MKIKHATKKDFKALLELQRLLIKSAIKKSDFKKYKTKLTHTVHETLNKPRKFFCFIAYDRTIPLGHINGCINKGYISNKRFVYVIDLFVKKEFRQQGIAKALMNKVIKFYKKKNIKKIKISSLIKNKTAIATWKKLGFKAVRTDFVRKI